MKREVGRTMSQCAGYEEMLQQQFPLAPGVNSMRRAKVAFARDCSGSMAGEKAQQAQRGCEEAIAGLGDPANRGAFLVGIVDFSDVGTVVAELTRAADLAASVPPMNVGGSTAIGSALEAVDAMFSRPHPDDERCVGNPNTVILFSDGQNMTGPDPVAIAQRLNAKGVVIVTVAIGDDADCGALEAIAGSPQRALKVGSGAELRNLLPGITKTLAQTIRHDGDVRKTLKMSEIQNASEPQQ